MSRIREKYPAHIPCLVRMPDDTELKLLLTIDATASVLMQYARKKWSTGEVSSHEALLLFCGSRICMGTTRVASLDTSKPEPVRFIMKKESTFG